MNKRLIAGLAAVAMAAFAANCSSGDDDDKNNGGNGGTSATGGKGGTSPTGGKGGSGGSGGSGGNAVVGGNGGSAPVGGSGGSAVGGSGGSAVGGSGGGTSECPSLPAAKTFTFETDADLWQIKPGGDDRVMMSTVAPALSETQKRGASGKSMALSVNTADGQPPNRRSWFYGVKDVTTLGAHLESFRTISLWIWLPVDHKLEHMMLVYHSPTSFPEGQAWQSANILGVLTPGQWSKAELLIPPSFICAGRSVNGFHEMGLYFATKAGETWNGTFFVDDFEISAKQ